ncbi:MAG: hydrogenase maturation nickel metallochaperone HypA [Dehalococcoidia bacterium]|nr:hydrogenase maturation nickel metallochaperone HypA [Dehalococcoidia bacterium]
MHEYGITESLLNIVEQKAAEAGVERVAVIRIVVGVLTGFAPDSIEFYFGPMSQNTVAEGATLEFEELPVQLRCRVCKSLFTPRERDWTCHECGSSEVDIEGGRELYIKEMEVS